MRLIISECVRACATIAFYWIAELRDTGEGQGVACSVATLYATAMRIYVYSIIFLMYIYKYIINVLNESSGPNKLC